MTTETFGERDGVRAIPGNPLLMPALVSPARVHLPWMAGAGLIAGLLVIGLYLLVATRFSATVEIAFDAGGRTIPIERLEAYLSAPARLGATVDRLHLADRPDSPASRMQAIARLWQGIAIEQSDLTNVFQLHFTGSSRRGVAPIANALAGEFLRADSPRSSVHVHVIAPATDPVAPDGSLLLPVAAALLAAALAAAAMLILRERRQVGPRSARSAEAALGWPVVAMIPAVSGLADGDRATLTDMPVTAQQSDYARAFRRLLASGQPQGRVIAVCSALAGEGKSTFAISLARTAALAGRRVALVDCDGRVRAASIALDVVGRPGLVQVMDGAVPLDDALVADTRSSLRILPHSQDAEVRSFWAKDSMAGLLTVTGALSRAFDLVVIDTPPLLALVEARDIASVADEALVVARWRATPLGALRNARSMLAEKGTRASLVLSFVWLAEPDREPIVPIARRRRRPGQALAAS